MLAQPMPVPLVPAVMQRGHASPRHTEQVSCHPRKLKGGGGCGLVLPKVPA